MSQIQTLSNISIFKLVCILFIFFDILSRCYFISYFVSNYAMNKWIFGVIIVWITLFLAVIVLLFMIRAESVQCFAYLKDVIDPSQKAMIFQQILRLNVMCISFVIYCLLMLAQINIQIFGKHNQIAYFVGMYNQWIVANSVLIIALLYNLRPAVTSRYDQNFNLPLLDNQVPISKFEFLKDIEIK